MVVDAPFTSRKPPVSCSLCIGSAAGGSEKSKKTHDLVSAIYIAMCRGLSALPARCAAVWLSFSTQ